MGSNTTLTIDTIKGLQEDFDDDTAPFLLAMVQGSEGISTPFVYDVTLYRPESLPEIQPSEMINTQASIGIRHDDNKWIRRRGMISAMAKTGTTNVRYEAQNNFFVYTARIVPAFKMLDSEVTFRVFEDMNLQDIFGELLKDFPSIPHLGSENYVDFSQLTADDMPKLDYCVQFGESTYNFLCRLMAQFGIWYIFDHRYDREQSVNETMVLGKSLGLLQQCEHDQMKVVLYDAKKDAIAAFSRAYTPAHHHVWCADFNESDPTQPPVEPKGGGDRDVSAQFDLMPNEPKTVSRFSVEQFPNNGDAETAMRLEESGVYVGQGQTENRTFLAGRTFQIIKDETGAAGTDKNFLITTLSFAAYENSYGHSTGWDLLNLLGDFTWKLFTPEGKRALSVLGNMSTQGMANYLQNEGPWATRFGLDNNGGATKPYFPNFFAGGLIAMGAGAIQALFDGIDKIIKRHDDKYGNAFMAIPAASSGMWRMPLPSAKQPTVNGSHLAVVIGTDGTEESQRGQIYSNEKGQVRIRFGWQRTVPLASGATTTDPLKSDKRAAWVRVSDGWAGRQYGTQYLPRIGDEVVVTFIDGDPSRPLIIGRVYNDYAHQPFDPVNEPARSGIKTQSTPKDYNSAQRFHLIRFDDAMNKEQFLIRSQGRTDVTTLGTYYDTIGGSRNLTIGGKDVPKQIVWGDQITKIYRNYDLHVGDPIGGSMHTQVENNYELTVKKDTLLDLEQNLTAVVKQAVSINGASIVLEASQKITLKVGSSSIVLTPCAIYIQGPMHNENCGDGGADSAASATLQNLMDPAAADPGTPADWLAKQAGGGGGGPGTHTAEAQHAPPCAVDPDNNVCVDPDGSWI
jgi:uncharacterized protein involved in type VI secretion and phage assembly